MGYLDNSSITVDAILTKKGRELLAKGSGEFNITQFALGDDEVDYTLWNPDHPLGSDYYGVIIENLPIVEAIPDETQALRSKLITLPKSAQRIPIIASVKPIDIKANQTADITPQTSYVADSTNVSATTLNATFGYTCVLSDNTIGTITAITPIASNLSPSTFSYLGTNNQSVSVVGLAFRFTANGTNLDTTKTAFITIIGNETGGSVTIPVTVSKFTTL